MQTSKQPHETSAPNKLTQHYETRLQGFYDAVNHLETALQTNKSISNWTYSEENGRQIWSGTPPKKWVREYNPSLDITTYTYYGTDEDKKKGVVGTNGTTMVKRFGKNAYDYLTTHHIMAAAEHIITSLQDASLHKNTIKDELTWLEWQCYLEAENKALHDFTNQHAAIDPNDPVVKNRFHSKEDNDAFKIMIEEKLKIIRKYHEAMLERITYHYYAAKHDNQKIIRTSPEFSRTLAEINEVGIEHIARNGRPNIIKIGEMAHGLNPDQIYVSAQWTVGDITNPSSKRSAPKKLGDEYVLSNRVRDITARIHKEGDKNTVQVISALEGHSSYPPINERDSLKRRYYARDALRNRIIEIATEFGEITPSGTLELRLCTMMLLTPMLRKHLEAIIRGKASEHGQLSDIKWAIESLRTTQPITTHINGQPVNITFDYNYMNFGVNTGISKRIILDPLEEAINERGIFELSDDYWKRLDDPTFADLSTLNANLTKNSINLLTQNHDSCKKFSDEMAMTLKDIDIQRGNLHKSIQHLEERYLIEAENNNRDACKKILADYNKARKNVLDLDDHRNALIHQYTTQQEKFIRSNESSLRQTIKEIDQIIQYNKLDDAAKKSLLRYQRFLKLQLIFYTDDRFKKEHNYHFHVNYCLFNQDMGRIVEAFCKSSEDRTGLLRILCFAYLAFLASEGREPDYHNPSDMEKLEKAFLITAHELGASLDNTEWNSFARGLQVHDNFTNFKLLASNIGKMNAGSAKKPFSVLKKKYAAWRFIPESVARVNMDFPFDYAFARDALNQTTPRELASDLIKKGAAPNNIQKVPFTWALQTTDEALRDCAATIALYRKESYSYIEQTANKTLLIMESDQSHTPLKPPVHPNESYIQMLRYIRGLLLIANHQSSSMIKQKLSSDIKEFYKPYLNNDHMDPSQLASLVKHSIKILGYHIKPSEGLDRQLTMARDLGIMLETHPDIASIAHDATGVVIQKNEHLKIDPHADCYQKEFTNLHGKTWFKQAMKLAKISYPSSEQSWLENFFKNANNIHLMAQNGMSAPPSARWLPLPGNVERTVITVTKKPYETQPDGTMTASNVQEHTIIRTGTIASFDIDHEEEIKRIAIQNLQQTILSHFETEFKKFAASYHSILQHGGTYPFDINYQTLVTPLSLPDRLVKTWVDQDNGTRFINISKYAMDVIQKDAVFNRQLQDIIDRESNGLYNIQLNFAHTNAAINKFALAASSQKIDLVTRQSKITAIYNLYKNHYANADPDLKEKILHRVRAARFLEKLLRNEEPYAKLETYQRNLMMVALESLVDGEEGLHLGGCKSGRDRTAIYLAAITAMMQNQSAMHNFAVLNNLIIKQLLEGHQFRALSHHCGIVKVSLVHRKFMSELPKDVQSAIKNFMPFTKKISVKPSKEDLDQQIKTIDKTITRNEEVLQSYKNHLLSKTERKDFLKIIDQCKRLAAKLPNISSVSQTMQTRAAKMMDTKMHVIDVAEVDAFSEPRSDPEQFRLQSSTTLPRVTGSTDKKYEIIAPMKQRSATLQAHFMAHEQKSNIYFNIEEIKRLCAERNNDSKIKVLDIAATLVETYRKNASDGIIHFYGEKQLPKRFLKYLFAYCEAQNYSYFNHLRYHSYFTVKNKDIHRVKALLRTNEAVFAYTKHLIAAPSLASTVSASIQRGAADTGLLATAKKREGSMLQRAFSSLMRGQSYHTQKFTEDKDAAQKSRKK